MSLFLDNAERIFLTASQSAEPGTLAILVGSDGTLRLLASADGPLDSLAASHGARTGYKIERRGGRVTVEGLDTGVRCRLERGTSLHPWLRDQPRYRLASLPLALP